MKLNRFVHISLVLILLFSLWLNGVAANESVGEMLEVAREQFYAAVEDEKRVEPTIALFKRIGQMEPKYAGRTQVYIGALVALKGKHAFFPHTKLKWVNSGLAIMDSGLEKDSDDIEALFIHGTTCYHLPFFFRRRNDARRDFKAIIKYMPMQVHTYDPKLITNIVVFLFENAKLTRDEKLYLQTLKDRLKPQRPVAHQ